MQIITCLVLLTYTTLNLYIPLIIANAAILLEFMFFLILKLTYDKNHIKKANESKREIYIETDINSQPNSPCPIHKTSEV